MKENHTLALIVSYYLSKFNKVAYEELNFPTYTAAHAEIGRLLNVNPNSVKNWRDEFDPLHDNVRAGYYQRPLRPSRKKVAESFQDLSEEEMRDIVLEILTNPEFGESEGFIDVVNQIQIREKSNRGKSVFIVRGPTGRKAEEHFISYHKSNKIPAPGVLRDTRDQGCGYDFVIESETDELKIEVKGLDGVSGGVSFTSKEWDSARKLGNSYYLVIVRNVSTKPAFQIIQNPYRIISPKKSVFTTVQVRWNVSESNLAGK